MFGALEARILICPVCKKKEKETFFGIGFPNWLKMLEIYDDKTKENPIICPECRLKLFTWLNGTAEIILKKK